MKRVSTTSILGQNNKACTKYLQPKSRTVHVMFWALLLLEANTILIFFWTELGQAENFLIAPRKLTHGNKRLGGTEINVFYSESCRKMQPTNIYWGNYYKKRLCV